RGRESSAGRVEITSSLRLIVAGRRFCGMKLVIVFYVNAQAGVRRKFCIARRKLFFVSIQEEIEWVVWIHVDQDQIRIVHEQLAEAETLVLVGHVISGANIFHGFGIRTAEDLNNVVAFNSYGDDLAFNMRRRQDLFEIKDQIVLLSFYARNFALLDQPAQFDAEEIHQTFYREMHGLDFLAVQAKFSVSGGNENPLGRERDVPFIMKLSLHFQMPLLDDDG